MKTTKEYFKTSIEILKTRNKDGYTKEECLLFDESVNTRFYDNEQDAADGAQWQREHGFCLHEMLKMTDGRIAALFC